MKTIFALSLCYLLSLSYALLGSDKLGINYGRIGNNLPSPFQSIELLESMKAGHVKLYDSDPEVLKLLSGTNIHVSIMVANDQICRLASNQSEANLWVHHNVLAYYPSTKIRFVLVGNEVFSYNDRHIWADLVPAMRNIKKSLNLHDIHNIKVGTPVAMDVLESSFPPSSGRFRSNIPMEVMTSLMKFLNGTRSFFFLDVYPYFPWSQNPTNISLDFALLNQGNRTYIDPDSGLIYTNLLDQMIDSVYFAMQKLGFDNVMIAIAETGWPHEGDIDQPGANNYNAATYLCNLAAKMSSDPPLGTPAKPGVDIHTFIFSLYDENQKPGPGTERHWGMLNNRGRPIHKTMDLAGSCPAPDGVKGYLAKPVNNRPYRGKIWCVVGSATRLVELAAALDFACRNGNGTCDELAPGKSCYEPVSVIAHASYAFSSYWAKFRGDGASCFFNGLAVQTTVDPTGRFFVSRSQRVYCDSQTKEVRTRKFSPVLESELVSGNEILPSNEWKTVPDIWRTSAEKFGDRVALVDPYHDPPTNMTYKELEQEILNFCEGLRVIGLKPEEKLALFADNSCRWLVSDQGIMATGAINVVRGTRSSVEELLQIYNHSESVALVVDDPVMYNRISETFGSQTTVRFIVLLWGEKTNIINEAAPEVPIYSYKELIDLGRQSREALRHSEDARRQFTYETISSDDIATLVYTSGTTGNPKGVMLTHKNLLHQINNLWDIVPAVPGDRFLSMLPPWHAYERACEYFIFTHGIEHVYTSVKNLRDDLRRYQPHYVISVPLVYETLYSAIQKQIRTSSAVRKLVALLFLNISFKYMEARRIYEGKCLTRNLEQPSHLSAVFDWLWARTVSLILWPLHALAKKIVYTKIHSAIGISKAGISGGGSLAPHIDKFFEAIGVTVQNGYGLTESSPVVAARRLNCNVLGSIGHPLKYTEIKVFDPETDAVLPHGSKGIVKVRGPQVMKGYYKNLSATKQAIDEDGWLNTGDIGWICPPHSRGRSRQSGGVIVLEGRAKDTIVLSTGENVEPAEIEEAALRSSLIQQIVVIGQDQRRLGAIIVPNKEEIILEAKRSSEVEADATELSKQKQINLLHKELIKWTSGCSFQVGPILVLDDPFTIDSGLMTPTMKIRRDQVVSLYKEQIDNLYKGSA
ncbi:acyl-activating enzyme 15 [Perilla frutescens var. hirtella]|uniref:glucan endo-1,3-beta-D-glucosidase n=1 Tax=Perilla frutescens var. hirtella TaxID=608512 RepID=A0AAD4IVM9_PERFH|nr:acyl-activating enzyme 15 [Perilla frutescens var. hirtella]